MKNRLRSKAIVSLACLIGIVTLAIAGFGLIENLINKTESHAGGNDSHTDSADGARIYYDSAWHIPRENIETILFMGVDKFADDANGRTDSEQADFLAVLILDKESDTMQILHLNRDTMTNIPMTDIAGVEYGTTFGQLALAHTYGSNEQARCRNTIKAVQELLYGVEIDHYVSVTMDALAILNDSVGGVTVQIPEDMTAVDPAFRKDAIVTLRGAQALSFVRARGALEDSSNLSRMERQRQYIYALFEAVAASENNDENKVDALLKLNEHMASDYTIDQMNSLGERLKEYAEIAICSLPGEAVKGAEFMEYHIDEAAAQALVVELFYEVDA